MFQKMTKRTKVSVLLGILCVLFLAGGIYLYQRHTTETVQERIYVVPEQSERQAAPPPTTLQRTLVYSPAHTYADDETHHGDIDSEHDHEFDASAGAAESDSFVTDDLITEDIDSGTHVHDAEQARIDNLVAQVEKLTSAINEKYPEITLLATVSPTEFDELYPTPEEQIELAQTLEKARGEFLGEFRSLFSQLPPDVREKALDGAHDHFTTYMGQGMADAIMTEVRSLLKQ